MSLTKCWRLMQCTASIMIETTKCARKKMCSSVHSNFPQPSQKTEAGFMVIVWHGMIIVFLWNFHSKKKSCRKRCISNVSGSMLDKKGFHLGILPYAVCRSNGAKAETILNDGTTTVWMHATEDRSILKIPMQQSVWVNDRQWLATSRPIIR